MNNATVHIPIDQALSVYMLVAVFQMFDEGSVRVLDVQSVCGSELARMYRDWILRKILT